MSIQVDWHSHILPGIDDGSQSVEESLSLLEMEAAQGINRVIATPHFYAHHDRPERFLENRQEAADRLRRAMGNRVGLPDIRLGAEVYFFRGMSHADILPHLAIQGSKYILVEMPQPPWPEDLYRELEEIVAYHGLTPHYCPYRPVYRALSHLWHSPAPGAVAGAGAGQCQLFPPQPDERHGTENGAKGADPPAGLRLPQPDHPSSQAGRGGGGHCPEVGLPPGGKASVGRQPGRGIDPQKTAPQVRSREERKNQPEKPEKKQILF